MLKARIKLRDPLPWNKEYNMINEGNFIVQARKRGEYIIFEKSCRPKPAEKTMKDLVKPPTIRVQQHGFELLVNGKLPEDIQKELIQRCNNVVNIYLNPDENAHIIEGRLHNIALTLPKHQEKFVREWMKKNLDSPPYFKARR